MNFFKYCPWDGYRFSESDKECFICKRLRYRIQSEFDQSNLKKKWQKILYQQQDYDDNYIDDTFLSGVITQDNSQNGPNYKDLIRKSADLIFAVNSVVLFLISYYCMLQSLVGVDVFISLLALFSILGSIAYILLTQNTFDIQEIFSSIKSIAIIIAFLLIFSPLFLTINQTYADNTIYILVTICIIYHLLVRDYDYESKVQPQSLKINTSTYASLGFASLLASRLHNEHEVFIMLYESFLFFIFSVFLKKSIKDYSLDIFRVFMIISTVSIAIILYILSVMLAIIYSLSLFFITFIFPLQIIWLYQYKNTIKGPWDLPKVKQYD